MDQSTRHKLLNVSVSCLWAIQIVVLAFNALNQGHAPIFIKDTLLPENLGRFYPKWDIVMYLLFIMVALIAHYVLTRWYRKSIHLGFVIVEACLTFLMISAGFKLVIYDNSPQLAKLCLNTLLVSAILWKIFYPELRKMSCYIETSLGCFKGAFYVDAFWLALIIVMVYMPDCERVMAMIFMGDWFHHFDYIVMSVGWASLWDRVPYTDVFSQYGAGLPIIFAKLIQFFGGFDYVPALRVMMWYVIFYFVGMYFFTRYWLGSRVIAGIAFLLIFRLQMFHYGVSPLVWSVPSASPLRFGADIFWMVVLLAFLRSGQMRWLIAAAIYSGFAVFYMTSTGLALMAAFYFVLIALLFFPALRDDVLSNFWRKVGYGICVFLPFIVCIIFFTVIQHGHVIPKGYWHNLCDYMEVFSRRAALPMHESLKYRHFWAFFMSMVMPLSYIATLMYVLTGLYLKQLKKEWLFLAVLCVQGLVNYQYYVVRSAITSYYVDALPFVLIMLFWFLQGMKKCPELWQNRLKITALTLSLYALLTNHNYLAYPNLINFSRNPMTDNLVIQRFPDRQGYFNNMYKNTKEEDKLPLNNLGTSQEEILTEDNFNNDASLVDYFKSHFNFKEDAALISRLTKPVERVALFSSFETKILIQAKRAPIFYNFPLLASRPMTFRTFPADSAHLPSYIDDTLGILNKERPQYVFMEKVFLQNKIPLSYQQTETRVLILIAYVKKHYRVFSFGKYLVAMKRI